MREVAGTNSRCPSPHPSPVSGEREQTEFALVRTQRLLTRSHHLPPSIPGGSLARPLLFRVHRAGALVKQSHAVFHRAVPERRATGHAAVSAGSGADADLRHYGSRQPGARLALHDRRLFRRHLRGVHRQLRRRPGARARRHPGGRHGGGGDRDAAALRPRPSRPRARHLRPAAVLQRGGAADLGARRHDPAAAEPDVHRGRGAAGRLLSALPPRHHPARRSRSRCCSTSS